MLIPTVTARELESLPKGTLIFYVETERNECDEGILFLSFNLFVVHHGELKRVNIACPLATAKLQNSVSPDYQYDGYDYTHDDYIQNWNEAMNPQYAILKHLGTLLFGQPDWFELVGLHTFKND